MADLHSKILEPPGPNSSNFMQFLIKYGKIVCCPPPRGMAPPPREILDPPLVRHKVGNVDIFVFYLNSKIKVDTVVRHIYLDSKYHLKCKFASTFIQLVIISI